MDANENLDLVVMLHDVRGARQPQRRAMASSLAPEESLLAQGGSLMVLTLEFFSHDSGDML